MEWDTAAGHAIANAAGKEIMDYQTKQPMLYNKENLLNNWFIVS
jgi:3'(2'), 5'-bisphosphate nucleotidase